MYGTLAVLSVFFIIRILFGLQVIITDDYGKQREVSGGGKISLHTVDRFTIDDDTPRCRPMAHRFLVDGTVYRPQISLPVQTIQTFPHCRMDSETCHFRCLFPKSVTVLYLNQFWQPVTKLCRRGTCVFKEQATHKSIWATRLCFSDVRDKEMLCRQHFLRKRCRLGKRCR